MIRLLLPALLVGLLAACGQKGPLYLPVPANPPVQNAPADAGAPAPESR